MEMLFRNFFKITLFILSVLLLSFICATACLSLKASEEMCITLVKSSTGWSKQDTDTALSQATGFTFTSTKNIITIPYIVKQTDKTEELGTKYGISPYQTIVLRIQTLGKTLNDFEDDSTFDMPEGFSSKTATLKDLKDWVSGYADSRKEANKDEKTYLLGRYVTLKQDITDHKKTLLSYHEETQKKVIAEIKDLEAKIKKLKKTKEQILKTLDPLKPFKTKKTSSKTKLTKLRQYVEAAKKYHTQIDTLTKQVDTLNGDLNALIGKTAGPDDDSDDEESEEEIDSDDEDGEVL